MKNSRSFKTKVVKCERVITNGEILPSASTGVSMCYEDGNLFFLGGRSNGKPVSTFQKFSLESSSFESFEDIPEEKSGCSSVVASHPSGDKFLFCFGCDKKDEKTQSRRLHVFSLKSGAWVAKAKAPVWDCFSKCHFVSSNIFCCHGWKGSKPLMQKCDMRNKKWQHKDYPELKKNQERISRGVLRNDRIYYLVRENILEEEEEERLDYSPIKIIYLDLSTEEFVSCPKWNDLVLPHPGKVLSYLLDSRFIIYYGGYNEHKNDIEGNQVDRNKTWMIAVDTVSEKIKNYVIESDFVIQRLGNLGQSVIGGNCLFFYGGINVKDYETGNGEEMFDIYKIDLTPILEDFK